MLVLKIAFYRALTLFHKMRAAYYKDVKERTLCDGISARLATGDYGVVPMNKNPKKEVHHAKA